MLKNILAKLAVKFQAYYAEEPARVHAAVVTLIVAIAGLAGLVISPAVAGAVAAVVAFVAPAVVGELTRALVTPPAHIAAVAVTNDQNEVVALSPVRVVQASADGEPAEPGPSVTQYPGWRS